MPVTYFYNKLINFFPEPAFGLEIKQWKMRIKKNNTELLCFK